MAEPKKNSMTVFKTDRHEDFAAIILAAVTVFSLLFYMAFIAKEVTVLADTSGVIAQIKVAPGAEVAKGDVMYVIEVTKAVWKGDVKEEVKEMKKVKAATSGKVVNLLAEAGQKVSKHKTEILRFAHTPGTLP